MGKYEAKKTKKRKRRRARKSGVKTLVLILAILLLTAALVLFVVPQVLYRLSGDAQIQTTEQTELTEMQDANGDSAAEDLPAETEAPVAAALEFPLLLEDGKLEIERIFQFDGINPDSGNQEGTNIATVSVTNRSDTYLESAKISVATDSGQILNFVIGDLPAGKTALAFSVENMSVTKDTAYTDAVCSAAFNPDASMQEERISASVEGIHITLRNNTAEEITNIVVYCRASLGDQYFGGITYTYNVNNLAAKGTAELDAGECFLGLAEIARIAINEQ